MSSHSHPPRHLKSRAPSIHKTTDPGGAVIIRDKEKEKEEKQTEQQEEGNESCLTSTTCSTVVLNNSQSRPEITTSFTATTTKKSSSQEDDDDGDQHVVSADKPSVPPSLKQVVVGSCSQQQQGNLTSQQQQGNLIILPPPPPTPLPSTSPALNQTTCSSASSGIGSYNVSCKHHQLHHNNNTIFCPAFVPPPSAFRSSVLSSEKDLKETERTSTTPTNSSYCGSEGVGAASCGSSSCSQFELSVEVESIPPPPPLSISSISSSNSSFYGGVVGSFASRHLKTTPQARFQKIYSAPVVTGTPTPSVKDPEPIPTPSTSCVQEPTIPLPIPPPPVVDHCHVHSHLHHSCPEEEELESIVGDSNFNCLSSLHPSLLNNRIRRNIIMSNHSDDANDSSFHSGSDSFWEPGNYKRSVKRSEDGFKLSNDLMALITERAEMEKMYAKSLKSWARKWSELIERGPEYGSTESAWRSLCEEADRRGDIHLGVRDKLSNDVISSIKSWQKDTYHKTMMTLKEKKEFEDNFKKVSS